jgi:hypothetical protein
MAKTNLGCDTPRASRRAAVRATIAVAAATLSAGCILCDRVGTTTVYNDVPAVDATIVVSCDAPAIPDAATPGLDAATPGPDADAAVLDAPTPDWAMLGGWSPAVPAVAARGAGLVVVVRGTDDGVLYWKWFDGINWHPNADEDVPYESLGAPDGRRFVSNAAIVEYSPRQFMILARADDAQIYWQTRHLERLDVSQSVGEDPWRALPGIVRGDPVAVSPEPQRVDVFVNARGGTLYWRGWYADSPGMPQWHPGSDDGWQQSFGPNVANGDPTVVSGGLRRIDAFARRNDNGPLIHLESDTTSLLGSGSRAWQSTDLSGFASDPVAVFAPGGRLHVFGCGRNGRIVHAWRSDPTGNRFDRDDPVRDRSGQEVACDDDAFGASSVVTDAATGRHVVHLFVRRLDYGITHLSREYPPTDPANAWDSENLGGSATDGVVAVAGSASELAVFARDGTNSNNTLRALRWNGSGWVRP